MINLTKWPLLLVSDQKVNQELAAEIIIRTSYIEVSTNNKDFKNKVNKEFGIPSEVNYNLPLSERITEIDNRLKMIDKIKNELGILDLEYLTNNQIASSFIGGPYGWINWQGQIGCNSFNIGKWPSHERVLCEWELIAKEWPELNFRSQLVPDEGDAEFPAVEYVIDHGKVTVIENPTLKLEPKSTGLLLPEDQDIILDTNKEIGCTIEQLKSAIYIVKRKMC